MREVKITVTGLVQGVGFRPAVAELAEEYHLSGQVKNMGGVVEIIVSGEIEAVESFLHRLKLLSGTVGRIDTLDIEEWNFITGDESFNTEAEVLRTKAKGFSIVPSSDGREEIRFLPADFPTCDRCREELFDKKNRRYRYPFISCTNCGPRYSIQKAVPYDRDSITMDDFEMCPACLKEYREKGNIRRHAQTIACHDCGPSLRLIEKGKTQTENERIFSYVIDALKQEKIVAIKDIGGFHFAFSPKSSRAAQRLRMFKHRDKKPFAIMFPDVEMVRTYCEVSKREEELLRSVARPIVLLKKKQDFVPEICGESDRMGVLLPCNPLQILLLEEIGPLVMTSGNRGGEPIIISDKEMEALMNDGCPDMMLTHDREILTPLDDSIYQVNGNFVQIIRRARGLVPEPIQIAHKLKQDTFAAGGDLKATFALGRGQMVYLSQYFGDLEDVRCMRAREKAAERMQQLLDITPQVRIGDLHPAYVSAQDTDIKVQHHMAHVASVIAEHGLMGPVMGIACDGTGYGTDGTIWGSEFFLWNKGKMRRVAHFMPVKLLGGDASAKEGDKTLFSYMMQARECGYDVAEWFATLGSSRETVEHKDASQQAITQQTVTLQEMAWKQNLNTVYSSSMGRLFDAVSALLDICHYNSYEGETAILLEQAAHRGKTWLDCQSKADPKAMLQIEMIQQGDKLLANSVKLIADLYHLKQNLNHKLAINTDGMVNEKEILAYFFHHAVADVIVTMVQQYEKLRLENAFGEVALSGGSFLNRILLREITEGLHRIGKKVYTNEQVPCGDGGIALGQMWLASCDEKE